MVSDNHLWLLSFYRVSEISGALFFGRLARSIKAGPIQRDMTKQFQDESAHAWYWTRCIESLGSQPVKVHKAYQDEYLEAAGMPVNIMEVLAITQVFEQRVIGQYARHAALPNLDPRIHQTLGQIMLDEKWHIQWIKEALQSLHGRYGACTVESTLEKFRRADREVYKQVMDEHEERLVDLLRTKAS